MNPESFSSPLVQSSAAVDAISHAALSPADTWLVLGGLTVAGIIVIAWLHAWLESAPTADEPIDWSRFERAPYDPNEDFNDVA